MSESTTADYVSNLVPWDNWLKEIGLDRSTGHRYRKEGIIRAENVFGRLYLTREEIARFESRVCAGEFSRKFAIKRLGKTAPALVSAS
jgi:hypothetical protein